MPPAARAAKAVSTPTAAAGPSRLTRARAMAKPGPADESGIADALERVLKVSEPAPQQKRKIVVASTSRAGGSKAVKGKEKPVAVMRAPASRVATATTSTGVEPVKPTRTVRPTAPTAGPSTQSSAVGSAKSEKAQPVAGPSRKMPASTASTAPPPSKSTATSTSASATRGIATQTTTSRVQSTARAPLASSKGTPATSVSSKGKDKALPPATLSFPWSDPNSAFSSSQRAVQAMAALNESIRSVSSAIQAGFRHQKPTDEWTVSRVEELVAKAELALQVMWQLDEAGKIGSKGIELDKGAQSLAVRLVQMNTVSKNTGVTIKPHL